MPIRPENLARYPKDWPAISASIRERAGHRCEWVDGEMRCAARQYAFGAWKLVDGIWQWDQWSSPLASFKHARQAAAEVYAAGDAWDCDWPKPTVIVLTVAHLNHEPEDCRPENLAAWCQRHHLAYDHIHHQTNAQASRRARVGQSELF